MSRRALPLLLSALSALTVIALGCEGPIDAGGEPAGADSEADPLAVPDLAEPGSLDALQREVILPSCAGQAGLCHHGQFEPNLSTAALTYENLVLRPSLERNDQARVVPGDPAGSLLIDKLRDREVISRMPLGAEPLAEEDIAAIEAWIQAGALRRPGAAPAPVLNNPPAQPELALFDATGVRLDGAGQVLVHPGDTLTLRMSVEDFETPDDAMFLTGFELLTADNRAVLLVPANGSDGYIAYGEYDAAAPDGIGDKLSYRADFTFTDPLVLVGDDGEMTEVPAAGLALTPLVFYADQPIQSGGMLTFKFEVGLIQVAP